MTPVFADTLHWIGLINPADQWHAKAVAAGRALGDVPLITTDEVLFEVLNAFAGAGPHSRRVAAQFVRRLIEDPDVEIVRRDWGLFLAALHLYERRPDQAYSLTDCSSMHVMRERRLLEVLTHDRHFVHEGFITLIPD